MVTGSEYVFENIDEAIAYVLDLEKKALAADSNRQKPIEVRTAPNLSLPPMPVDTLSYPYSSWFNGASDDKFIMTRLLSGRFSLKPNLTSRKFLFRGETEFHNPCKPSVFRNTGQHRFTAENVRGQELKILMMSHPLVELLDTGVELCGKEYQFEMNLYGLTQHYYNKTSLFDLTSDPNVAAFFATTEYNDKTDTYTPITDDNHAPGVLYYYYLDIKEDFGKSVGPVDSRLSTIGLQVFPRSGRQKGFLYNLTPKENFNDVVRLQAVFFKHKADISTRICAEFENGKTLFPDDILERHWKREYKDSNVISNRTVLMNKIDNPYMTLGQVEAEVRSLGFDIKDYRPVFNVDELDSYYDAVHTKGFWTDFCEQIYIPGDTSGAMMNDLVNLPNNPKYHWAFTREDGHVPDYSKGLLFRKYRTCLE